SKPSSFSFVFPSSVRANTASINRSEALRNGGLQSAGAIWRSPFLVFLNNERGQIRLFDQLGDFRQIILLDRVPLFQLLIEPPAQRCEHIHLRLGRLAITRINRTAETVERFV